MLSCSAHFKKCIYGRERRSATATRSGGLSSEELDSMMADDRRSRETGSEEMGKRDVKKHRSLESSANCDGWRARIGMAADSRAGGRSSRELDKQEWCQRAALSRGG
jgi:hypothetical protein